MPTIIALNPAPRKRRKGKKLAKTKKKKRRLTAKQKKYFGTKAQRKGVKTMARKKRAPAKRRRTRRAAKRVVRYSKKTLGGVNMMGAAKSTVPLLFGALVAKFVAKKFAAGGAETDNWSWKNYALALAGGFVAAFGTSAALRKPAAAQKVFEGALLLVAYKLFTNEIAPMNTYTDAWFSQAEDDFDPYGSLDRGDQGDMWSTESEDYVKGIDGYWRPTSESHRLPTRTAEMGDVMVTPDPRYGLGDIMVNPDPRYGAIPQAELTKRISADGM